MQPTSHLTQVDPSNNFQGKVVCVTGANGGIGKVITQAFARAGASVWALDIQSPSTSVPQPASPQTDPNTPSATSLNIHSLLLDVRDPEQWKQCVDQVLAIDKKIDVLTSPLAPHPDLPRTALAKPPSKPSPVLRRSKPLLHPPISASMQSFQVASKPESGNPTPPGINLYK